MLKGFNYFLELCAGTAGEMSSWLRGRAKTRDKLGPQWYFHTRTLLYQSKNWRVWVIALIWVNFLKFFVKSILCRQIQIWISAPPTVNLRPVNSARAVPHISLPLWPPTRLFPHIYSGVRIHSQFQPPPHPRIYFLKHRRQEQRLCKICIFGVLEEEK